MARLIVVLEVDVDPRLVDPHEVIEDILGDRDMVRGEPTKFAEEWVTFKSAEWGA